MVKVCALLVNREWKFPEQGSSYPCSLTHIFCEQTRFLDEEQTYRTFLEILDMYRKGEKSVRRLLYEVWTDVIWYDGCS